MKRGRDQEETPWASFADALAGMLFVFIITTVLFVLRAQEQEQRAQEQEQEAKIQKDAARDELSRLTGAKETAKNLVEQPSSTEFATRGKLTTCLDESNFFQVVPERIDARVSLYLQPHVTTVGWFESGSATLNKPQRPAVDAIRECIGRIASLPEVSASYFLRVYLEGHTDATPVSDDRNTSKRTCEEVYATNWELSAARAAAVLRVVAAPSDDAVTAHLDDGSLELLAVGLADTSPGWKRICEYERWDSDVCKSLKSLIKSGSDLRTDAVVNAALDGEECVLKNALGDGSCAGNGTQSKLCKWANGCKHDLAARRALLRRVDLRIELTAKPSAVLQPSRPQ